MCVSVRVRTLKLLPFVCMCNICVCVCVCVCVCECVCLFKGNSIMTNHLITVYTTVLQYFKKRSYCAADCTHIVHSDPQNISLQPVRISQEPICSVFTQDLERE